MESIVLKFMKVSDLEHAPWNPRSEEELALDNPAMVELISSVKASGVNQSLAVWDRGCDEPMLVIAGNRRLEAAKAAGIVEVPALVYTEITEARAHEITRTENEIRSGINPLKDAELIERMMSKGLSQKDIASHFGMSDAMVCRRVKLLGLVDEIRRLPDVGKIDTYALEQIALYPAETQRKCLYDIKRTLKRTEGNVRWKLIQYNFINLMKSLDGAKFDTKDCVSCPCRTGAQPDLWDVIPEDGELGSCLKCECYERKFREYLVARVKEEVGFNVQLVDSESDDVYFYNLNEREDFSDRKSKKCPVAWWHWQSWNDKINIIWGPTIEEYRETEKKKRDEINGKMEAEKNIYEEERAKREEEEAERKRIREERNDLADKVDVAAKTIAKHYTGLSDEKIKKCMRSGVVGSKFKGSAASELSKALMLWFTAFAEDDIDVIRFINAFPDLAKALKVKAAELKDFAAAEKALEIFDLNNHV